MHACPTQCWQHGGAAESTHQAASVTGCRSKHIPEMAVRQEARGLPHFGNWHAKLGLLTAALSTSSAVGGALAFGKMGLLQLFPQHLQPQIKTAHRMVSGSLQYRAFLGTNSRGCTIFGMWCTGSLPCCIYLPWSVWSMLQHELVGQAMHTLHKCDAHVLGITLVLNLVPNVLASPVPPAHAVCLTPAGGAAVACRQSWGLSASVVCCVRLAWRPPCLRLWWQSWACSCGPPTRSAPCLPAAAQVFAVAAAWHATRP